MTLFILYACPTGPLAEQVDAYFEQSYQQSGPNAAHAYMPHCTLTGFFQGEKSAIMRYTQALSTLFSTTQPSAAIHLKPLTFKPTWHGIPIISPQLEQIAATFAQKATSSTRTEAIRLKTNLHLSLAYGFEPTSKPVLKQLALELIDLSSPVSWEIRFYERRHEHSLTSRSFQIDDSQWICHFCQPLTGQ